MKTRRYQIALAAMVIGLLCAAGFQFLPQTNSQDEGDPVRAELSNRAFGGELAAIRALHSLNINEGNQAMAQVLALEGAFANDEHFRFEYVQYFRHRLTLEEQKRALLFIRQKSAPGTRCLVEILEDPTLSTCHDSSK